LNEKSNASGKKKYAIGKNLSTIFQNPIAFFLYLW